MGVWGARCSASGVVRRVLCSWQDLGRLRAHASSVCVLRSPRSQASRYAIWLARLGRDSRPFHRTVSGRMDDRRDWKLHHAVRVVRADLPGGIGGVLSLRSAATGRNSDYGEGQHFDLDRLISASAATMACSPTTPTAGVINRTIRRRSLILAGYS